MGMSTLQGNLDEVASPPPIQNLDESRQVTLEEIRAEQQGDTGGGRNGASQETPEKNLETEKQPTEKVSSSVTQLYTLSYLVFFAILGTLARLGLQAITFYPGVPVIFSSLWPNFAGSLIMGFLSEDRMLFKEEWGTPTYHQHLEKSKLNVKDEENRSDDSGQFVDLTAAKRAHLATKKTIPLYIGLATGFCGSFTSFSAFIRDVFLALSNDLAIPETPNIPRNGGYSFMALIAVILVTVTASLSALFIGAHLAIFLQPYTPSLPYALVRKVIDRVAVPLAWGSWLGAIILSVWPPDRHFGGAQETWRSQAVFALVFAPLGCLCRFYASLYLNGKISSFPLGTFLVNVLGTAILGMSWDLQHVPLGGIIGCQVLQGVEDGFCGCLTTVSTWVGELAALRRGHAYKYGVASVVAAFCFLVATMGSLRWTHGFANVPCTH